jgi:uncharacterized protein YjbJ (UPF0337 family)
MRRGFPFRPDDPGAKAAQHIEEANVKKDEAEGRIKEAAGDLTGDKGLQREGETDQAAGKVKDGVDSVADKAKDVVNKD